MFVQPEQLIQLAGGVDCVLSVVSGNPVRVVSGYVSNESEAKYRASYDGSGLVCRSNLPHVAGVDYTL